MYGKIKEEIGQILRKLCEQKGIEIIEAHACSDHIHMLLSIPPKNQCVVRNRILERKKFVDHI